MKLLSFIIFIKETSIYNYLRKKFFKSKYVRSKLFFIVTELNRTEKSRIHIANCMLMSSKLTK